MVSLPPPTDFAAFAGEYRQQVALAHETVRTLGLPTKVKRERDAHAGLPLREIFVPLRFHAAGGGEAHTLASVLAGGRSAVVLGDPGAGKSTLLAYLALLYAGHAPPLEGFATPEGKIPLFISLRDFARLQQASPGLSFIEYLERNARSDLGLAHAHRAFFEWALRTGAAVVLIDGLDEVGRETARHRIARAVRAFHQTYEGCPFWVTSRIYGYTRDVELPSTHFEELHIGRLDDDQVSTFVGRWYEIQVPNNAREREELAASLRHAVLRSGSVRRLASNPLLLTLMAFLHQSLGRLPQERGELYDLCIDMLLRTWQEARRGEGPRADPHPFEKLGLHVATQKDYLAHLALYVQERNDEVEGEDARGLVGYVEALDCLARRHLEKSRRGRPALDFAEAREEMDHFLDYLGDQTGLLVNRGNDKLAFLHLSFQEYLAAWVFLGGSGGADAGFFVKYLGAPAWEEVLLLRLYIVLRAPGGGGEEAFDRIVRAVFDQLGRMHFEPGWMMLARAVRDNLAFTPADREAVLRKVVELWARGARFEGEWFGVIEEICLFAEPAREALRGVLATMTPGEACSRLQMKLFGTVEERALVAEAPPTPKSVRPGAESMGTVALQATPGELAALAVNIKAAQRRLPELLAAAWPRGSLDVAGAEKVLGEVETSLGLHAQSPDQVAVFGTAMFYAEAIWLAFHVSEWSEPDMRGFADAILVRTTRLNHETEALLDVTLRMLGAYAAREQVAFILPTGVDPEIILQNLPQMRVWAYLQVWAGMDPRRRGVHARAIRHACCEMHDKGGGGSVQCLPLIMSVGGSMHQNQSADFRGAEMQSLQILSATWQSSPFTQANVTWLSPQSQRPYTANWEDMLRAGARLLSGQASSIIGDEQWWSFPHALSPDELPLTLPVPPEAILLRARPAAISRSAQALAALQGPHDGRAYEFLRKLAAHPEAEEVKHAYARMTVLAPWRLVREDPAWIGTFRWSMNAKGIFETFPASLDDLREMLSEPPGPLPPDRSQSSEIARRIDRNGVWSMRTDAFELMRMAWTVPGALSCAFIILQMIHGPDVYAQEVFYALLRLDRPEDMPAAQLAADIFFLRAAAEKKPFVKLPEGEIDLRERLPGLLVTVLRSVLKEPNPDTFAAAEASILRLCARVVENLAGPDPLAPRDRLWLTYRLFQWLTLQLQRMPNDARILGLRALRDISPRPPTSLPPDTDLLDPARFDRARFDHRLGAVLYALAFMDDVAATPPEDAEEPKKKLKTVSSRDLEQHLAEIAARPLSADEQSLRHREDPSCLGWYGPPAIPDMALDALLYVNDDAFLHIAPEARLRWIQDLPCGPDDRDHMPWPPAGMLFSAATRYAAKLTVAERTALEAALRSLQGSPEMLEIRWHDLTGLYEAGAAHLEQEIVALLEQNLADKDVAPKAFGMYLTGLSRLAPEKLVPEAERILAAVEAAGLDPIPFASALARPIISGAHTSVRPVKDCLRRLAARDPYRKSDEMTRLLGMLGVK